MKGEIIFDNEVLRFKSFESLNDVATQSSEDYFLADYDKVVTITDTRGESILLGLVFIEEGILFSQVTDLTQLDVVVPIFVKDINTVEVVDPLGNFLLTVEE